MNRISRRHFLSDVGQGMLLAGIGIPLAEELGLSTALALEESAALSFGALEPLVDVMQQTPVEKLQPILVKEIKAGAELKTLVAAGALANARAFAGSDYIGYHSMMALMPAFEIAGELPEAARPLPVLKVLYRNTARIQAIGAKDQMTRVQPEPLSPEVSGLKKFQKHFYDADLAAAEKVFAGLVANNPEEAYNDLQHILQDDADVHRVTLCWRSWDTLRLTGREHAETLLRQSVRYCIDRQKGRVNGKGTELRTLLPKLLDEHKLLELKPGSRRADAAWINQMAQQIFASDRAASADAVASAIAEGFHGDDIHEAISLAANLLILHDPGRKKGQGSKEKPEDSVHGASPGVHAQDAANAWRNIGRVSNRRNQICSLVVSGWHAAGQKKYVNDELFAYQEDARALGNLDADGLIGRLKAVVEARDQAAACAVVERWSQTGASAAPVFDLLRTYAVSEDGALHAEKYFRTITEEFSATREALRWRHLVGLARVSASEYGWAAPGRDQARDLLRIKA